MNIKELKFRNIGAYGNKEQELKFSEDGSLNLVVGKNGVGKCVAPETKIEIDIKDPLLKDEFLKFINQKVTV